MKTLRFLGMTLLIVMLTVNFTACSDDEDEPNSPIVGTWVEKLASTLKKHLSLTTMEQDDGMKIHSITQPIPIKW